MDADLHRIGKAAKKRLLTMHYESKVGHIGGNLSCLDALLALHHKALQSDDVFILSKGHAAGAYYVTLWSKGLLSDEELRTFHKDETRLAGHPIAESLPGLRFATGSLGHGLGLATGVALGRRRLQKSGRIYCLTSDGEWQEGSTWESLHFLISERLSNLCIMIDDNKVQGFGRTAEVLKIPELRSRLQQFDAELIVVPGHDTSKILSALAVRADRPVIIVLDSVKGNGVSYMENTVEWHYLPMSEAQYQQALSEIEQS